MSGRSARGTQTIFASRIPRLALPLGALILFIAFPGCEEHHSVGLEREWQVVGFESAGGSIAVLSPEDTIYLTFLGPDSVYGRAQGRCPDYYSGGYRLRGVDSLSFLRLSSSEAACNESRYWEYFDALRHVTRCEQIGLTLRLSYEDGTRRLLLRAHP